ATVVVTNPDAQSSSLSAAFSYGGADTWYTMSTASAPSGRNDFLSVWTGSKLVVWGGQNGGSSHLGDGGRYDPVANSWSTITASGAPSGRIWGTATWTGSKMVVWGGYDGSTDVNTGGQYDPAVDSWSAVTTISAPV